MEINNLNGQLIFRLLFIIPLVFLAFKALWFLMGNYKQKKEINVDFDELVRRKTEFLKFTGEVQENLTKNLNISNTEKVYKEFFSLPKNQNHPDKKKFFQVFSGLQWGESPLHYDLINYLKKSHNFHIDLIKITKSLKDIIKNDVLISPKWKDLPNFNDLEQILITKIIFDIFVEEGKNWGGQNLISFCQKEELDLKKTCKAIFFYFEPKLNKLIFSNILNNNQSDIQLSNTFKSSDIEFKIIQKILEQNNHMKFLNEISNLSLLFGSLKKIEPLRTKFDLGGAQRIFNLGNSPSLEDIKKRYKLLAKINHPDMLSSLKLPPEILKLVNGNFSQIKNAYDLLVANELTK